MKKILKARLQLNMPVSILLITALSGLATYIVFSFPPFTDGLFAICFEHSGILLIFLNWLPSFLSMLLIYFLTNNCVLACGATGFIVTLMSTVNNYKIQLRQAPFWPWDILLSGEVMAVSKSFNPALVASVIVKLALMLGLIVFCLVFVRNKKLAQKIRIGGILTSLVLIALSDSLLFRSGSINEKLYVEGNPYNDVNIYNSKGFLYSFLYSLANSKIVKPSGYNPNEIEQIAAAHQIDLTGLKEQKKPHIIMIMSEAFSDMALHPALDFSKYKDPMEKYREILEESLHGHIIVPNIGGGTSDTEFDVLTGIASRHYSGVPYSYSLITKPIGSFTNLLTSIGYNNLAIHPGYGWFYNRMNVYSFMGFERFIDIEAFDPETQYKGMYINEKVTIDQIISEFENHISSGNSSPLFEFCVTIQNHGPYEGKYGAVTSKNFDSYLPFTEEDINALSNYFHGLDDSVTELARLIEYLKASDEPVVLVYFGDHLPGLSDYIYKYLLPYEHENPLDEATIMYQTPYIIWENDAAKNLVNIYESPDNQPIISSSYLGVLVLKTLGYDKVDSYFNFLSNLYENYPALLVSRYSTRDGILKDELLNPTDEISLLRKWEYYRLLEKK